MTTGGVTRYRYHLLADSREVAEVNLSNSGSTVNETVSYVLSDHLGSVDVVQTVNPSGTVLSTADMSFGAWEGRREPGTWEPPVGATETQTDHTAEPLRIHAPGDAGRCGADPHERPGVRPDLGSVSVCGPGVPVPDEHAIPEPVLVCAQQSFEHDGSDGIHNGNLSKWHYCLPGSEQCLEYKKYSETYH